MLISLTSFSKVSMLVSDDKLKLHVGIATHQKKMQHSIYELIHSTFIHQLQLV